MHRAPGEPRDPARTGWVGERGPGSTCEGAELGSTEGCYNSYRTACTESRLSAKAQLCEASSHLTLTSLGGRQVLS